MEGARTHLHVIGLNDRATALGPEGLQLQNQFLKRVGASRHLICHSRLPPEKQGAQYNAVSDTKKRRTAGEQQALSRQRSREWCKDRKNALVWCIRNRICTNGVQALH